MLSNSPNLTKIKSRFKFKIEHEMILNDMGVLPLNWLKMSPTPTRSLLPLAESVTVSQRATFTIGQATPTHFELERGKRVLNLNYVTRCRYRI